MGGVCVGQVVVDSNCLIMYNSSDQNLIVSLHLNYITFVFMNFLWVFECFLDSMATYGFNRCTYRNESGSDILVIGQFFRGAVACLDYHVQI